MISGLLCSAINLFVMAVLVRVVLSWFPSSGEGAVGQVRRLLDGVTEPVLGPVRRLLPSAGPFDFSPIVVILVLQLLVAPVVCRL